MNQMTGGSLPAQTWHEIMAYAHQGVELRPIPLVSTPSGGRPSVAEVKQSSAPPDGGRPSILTRRGTEALLRIEKLMDDAARVLATSREPSKTPEVQGAGATQRQEASANGPEQGPAEGTQGN
jgi:penicillin-binding protein 1A